MECYDELGNRYQLPAYCLAPPVNLITERSDSDMSDHAELQEKKEKEEFQLKVTATCTNRVRRIFSISLNYLSAKLTCKLIKFPPNFARTCCGPVAQGQRQ